jgi:hypothetical protein
LHAGLCGFDSQDLPVGAAGPAEWPELSYTHPAVITDGGMCLHAHRHLLHDTARSNALDAALLLHWLRIGTVLSAVNKCVPAILMQLNNSTRPSEDACC